MTTHLQDYVELLNAEQHVQLDKLKEGAKYGVSARVRGVSLVLIHLWSTVFLVRPLPIHVSDRNNECAVAQLLDPRSAISLHHSSCSSLLPFVSPSESLL